MKITAYAVFDTLAGEYFKTSNNKFVWGTMRQAALAATYHLRLEGGFRAQNRYVIVVLTGDSDERK